MTSLPDGSLDTAVSSFGLKTFNAEQLGQLTAELARVLRPGGSFSSTSRCHRCPSSGGYTLATPSS